MSSDGTVIYNGNSVKEEHFRAFIFKADGDVKLVNSWEEYKTYMSTGVWYSNKLEVVVKDQKPKKEESKKNSATPSKSNKYRSIEDEHFTIEED